MSHNTYNILLKDEHVRNIFKTLDLTCPTIHDLMLYQEAFVHCSFVDHKCQVDGFSTSTSYDVLEFLGDKVLDLIMTFYLKERFAGASEDRLTQLRIGLVRSHTLAQFAKTLNFHRYVLIAEPIEFLSLNDIRVGRFNDQVLEDVFEAFLGALFIDQKKQDQGLRICTEFVTALLEKQVDFAKLVRTDQDPKGTFMSYCHSKSWQMPRLVTLTKNAQTTEMVVALYMQKVDCEFVIDKFAQSMITRNASKFIPLTEEDAIKENEVLICFETYINAHRKKIAIQMCYVKAMERFKNKY